MGIFNRVAAIVALCAVMALGIAIGAIPFVALGAAQQAIEWMGSALRQAQEGTPHFFVSGQIATVVLALLIPGFMIWLEIRRARPGAAPVAMEGEAQVHVTIDSVAQRLEWHLAQLADVRSVRPSVRSNGRRVDVDVEIETAPEIEVPMKTEEVIAVVREVVVDRMGLHLGKLDVRIRHAPFQKRTESALG